MNEIEWSNSILQPNPQLIMIDKKQFVVFTTLPDDEKTFVPSINFYSLEDKKEIDHMEIKFGLIFVDHLAESRTFRYITT